MFLKRNWTSSLRRRSGQASITASNTAWGLTGKNEEGMRLRINWNKGYHSCIKVTEGGDGYGCD